MKRLFLIVAVLAFVGSSAFAQKHRRCGMMKCDTVSTECIQRMTEDLQDRLMLDDATAKKFAPMYQAYMEELRENCPRLNRCEEPCKTDEEIMDRMENRLDMQKKMISVKEKYLKKFSSILTPKQVREVMKSGRGQCCGMRAECPEGNRPLRMQRPMRLSGAQPYKVAPGARLHMNRQVCPQMQVCPAGNVEASAAPQGK